MNKYQVALENIKIAPGFMGGNFKYFSHTDSRTEFMKDICILQELVNKATPKKPNRNIAIVNGYRQQKHYCPNCNHILIMETKYCKDCGQALDKFNFSWSNENE